MKITLIATLIIMTIYSFLGTYGYIESRTFGEKEITGIILFTVIATWFYVTIAIDISLYKLFKSESFFGNSNTEKGGTEK